MGMPFDKKTLIIPDSTIFEEHNIVTNSDVIISDRTNTEYGIITDKRVFIGERVNTNGSINAKDDIRVDMFSAVNGDIKGEKDIYLGEKVRIFGKVGVGRDLDVGDDVRIEKGFEARGWINIRNPIPIVIYLFIYLMELLMQGKSKEVDRILKELEKEDNEMFLISKDFMFVPKNSFIGVQETRIKGNARIGNRCRILGNHFVSGDVQIGDETEIYGKIKAEGDVMIGEKSIVNGDVECKGNLTIEDSCQVFGDVTCKKVEMFRSALINGTIKAENGIRFKTVEDENMNEKLERFNLDVDVVENIITD
jgi:predicted acyltransferase (DUF342 family)